MFYLWVVLLLVAQSAVAQFTAEGTVTDAQTGDPLVGANIYHQDSNRGTTTNVDGAFVIELPGQSATLRITYIGYITQSIEVSAEQSTDLQIELTSDIANLEEVVVTGLASSVKRSNLANAVSSISAKDISEKVAPPTIDRAMQGKIPGVEIMSTGGAPGGGFNVQLRGVSTLGAGSSQPLYIVDGVYIDNSAIRTGRSVVSGATSAALTDEDDAGVQDGVANRLADLNPEDIQSIEILKGPSAAAIYGQRANAGVIIINTKQGAAGETQVSFSQEVGFNSPLKLLGRTNWTEERIIAFHDDADEGLNAATQLELDRFRTAQENGTIRDLEEVFFDNRGVINKTQISISGGDAKTRFFVSGNIDNEDGIITNTGFNRNSLRANLSHSISDRVSITSNTNFVNTESNRGFTGNQNNTGGSLTYNLASHPNYAYGLLQPDQLGGYPDSPYFAENPFRLVDVATNDQDVNRLLQSVILKADLATFGASKLSLDAQGGFDFIDANSIVHFPEFMQFQRSQSFPGIVVHGENRSLNTNLQAFLVLNTDIKSGIGNINLTSQAGWTRFTTDIAASEIQGTGLLPGQTNTDNAAQISTNQNFANTTEVGFAAQQEANWEDRIIATIGARFDRSTLNLDQEEYTLYPKASLAINWANFDFWNINDVNLFKLRAAYGETGGVPLFGNTFTTLGTGPIGDRVGAIAPVASVDSDLKPERAKEIELGLDLGLFDGRISFEGTYYNKTVEDLILDLEPSPSTGLTTGITTNAAELENVGWEFGLSASPILSQNLSWNTNVLWWTNKSEITELVIPGQTNQALGFIGFGATRIEEGVSPTAIFGLPNTEEDQFGGLTKWGDFQPDFQMSWNNEFSYSNFAFNFLFHWSKGGENLDLYQLLLDGGGNTDDYFREGSTEVTPRPGPFSTTEYYIQDASYIKLREASLYYTVPTATLQEFFGGLVKRVRFGVSGTDLLMFTDFRGYDPEVNFEGRNTLIRSVSIAPYPSSKKLLFSIDLDF
ncbi:SusC/RagA family TonB-linked outer membrane protein [Aliifodinibius sp. 1BSP15-2V2]|uniref:SusC/RagA family TonB-linked outer membrane protein n=2 Tax=Fodinibius salsisoli TaxID=2820877 RepID=A0ABT3PP65_9BACT|nr:SusC/RagA family TonB-linked outer membrane protein [Fodinibius salsisoli]